MKLIDQTPLQNEQGEIGLIQRLQGTLKYGFEWYPEQEAQKVVIAHLTRILGKGYTAIRNQTLGASGITVPLALVGPAGIYAIHVTNLHGTYQAKADSWGQIFGVNFQPARVNILIRTRLLARALQAFIERQGVKLPKPVEPVILAANPGLHVESMQPIVRVVMVDALERWGASVETAAPIFTLETSYELADRIVNPRPAKKEETPEAAALAPANSEEEVELSRDGDEAEPFNPASLDFAFEEEEGLEVPPELVESSPAIPIPSKGDEKRRMLGMSMPQLALLGGMILVEICVLVGFAIVIFLNS
jgi:disulfide bond formation protein DsbB